MVQCNMNDTGVNGSIEGVIVNRMNDLKYELNELVKRLQ